MLLVVSSPTIAPINSFPARTGCAADTITARSSGEERRRVVGSPAKVAVELELSLSQRTDGKLLFLDTYRVVTVSENGTVGAAVKALNKALGKVYASFTADISKI